MHICSRSIVSACGLITELFLIAAGLARGLNYLGPQHDVCLSQKERFSFVSYSVSSNKGQIFFFVDFEILQALKVFLSRNLNLIGYYANSSEIIRQKLFIMGANLNPKRS